MAYRKPLSKILNGVTRFGKLTVIGEAPDRYSPSGFFARMATVKCDCGVVKQVRAGDLRQAREQWPQAIRERMDTFLIEDVYPRLSHRARDRDLGLMRNALDRLALYLRLM